MKKASSRSGERPVAASSLLGLRKRRAGLSAISAFARIQLVAGTTYNFGLGIRALNADRSTPAAACQGTVTIVRP